MPPEQETEQSSRGRVLGELIAPGERFKWVVVAVTGIVTAAAESIAALLVAALIAAMTEAGGASLELPVIGDVTDWLPGDSAGEQLRYLAIVTGIFFIFKGFLLLARAYIQSRVALRTGARISTRLFQGYLSMPYSFHISHNSSELIRNASWAADEVVSTYLVPLATIIVQVALLVSLLAVLIAAAPTATLITIGVLIPLTIGIVQVVRPRLRRLGVITKDTVQASFNVLQQSFHGIRDVKVLGRERYFARDYRSIRNSYARSRYLSVTLGFVPSVGIETLVILAIIGFVAINSGGGLSSATLPTIGLFAYAGLRMMPATSSIVASVNKLRYGQAVAETVAESLTEIDTHRVLPPQEVEPVELTHALELENVTFSYDGETDTLSNINLRVERGESLGIVGETGAGKSTLLDVMLGLLEPRSGTVRVDGVDVKDIIRSWHAIIGLVPQQIYLLDDTIRKNIAYGLADEDIDDGDVRSAIQLAQLERFLSTLPDGPETRVGERGIRLSGGQRQRVAIARSLYRHPQVLIFDEGTASLDNVTEAELLRAIDRLRGEHTIVTVAHRLTTVKGCDRIILLENGEIADEGTYQELRDRNVTFRKMTG